MPWTTMSTSPDGKWRSITFGTDRPPHVPAEEEVEWKFAPSGVTGPRLQPLPFAVWPEPGHEWTFWVADREQTP